MKIISRKYGVGDNHVRFVVLNCVLQEHQKPINKTITWKGKRPWEFEVIKYELQDHCFARFKGMEDSMFIIKSLDYSEHKIYDDLYKHDSDEYVKWLVLIHLTRLFENRNNFPEFMKYSNVFNQYIEMNSSS
jgi:hypothetical protein